MKISTILDHIDSGYMALPEFQRGYVWNRDQVRGLMRSLYRRYPVGSLLVWATGAENAPARGDAQLAPGVVKLILDGQQRVTSLYGLIRGNPPQFFDGRSETFTGLHFNLDTEEFAFYSPLTMQQQPRWIDVSRLMLEGPGAFMRDLLNDPDNQSHIDELLGRLQSLYAIRDVDLHIEEVTGDDKTIDVVVDIFNRVNSGGTKLSKGDLALAKICATRPEARSELKETLARWRAADYNFSMDWFLRSVNTVANGEARFEHMHDMESEEFHDALRRATRSIDFVLNSIAGRLGLDHDRVFFGRYAMPVMAHYVDRRGGHITDPTERDKLLFWYLQSSMWGRFSGSTETILDRDLQVLQGEGNGPDLLISELRTWRGGLEATPENFAGWSLGARFYPVLYLLTRMGEARDWGSGLPLRSGLLGQMSQLEVHHIFPKNVLYPAGYKRPEVNAVANYCLLTKDTNLQISDRPPDEYLTEIQQKHPGALESQWIPADSELWKIENYLDFLRERRQLLANAANQFLQELFHGELGHSEPEAETAVTAIPGGIDGLDEEWVIESIRDWATSQGLPEGEISFALSDTEGHEVAVLDLAWPDGLQSGLSQPVAVLIDENGDTMSAANSLGYRCFTSESQFRHYVETEVLAVIEMAD